MKICLFIIATALFSLCALGGEYYLAPDGNDSNPGTCGKPWSSLQKAVWRMSAGDTLVVRGGKYSESSFADIKKTSKGVVSTIRAEKGEIPVFDGRIPRDSAVSEWKRITDGVWQAKFNPKWRRLDGLWVQGEYYKRVKERAELSPGTWWLDKPKNEGLVSFKEPVDPKSTPMEYRLHSMLEVDTPFWKIDGITAQYFNYAGIVVSSTHHVTIQNCKTHHNGGAGIEGDEASSVRILDNEAAFNGAEGGPGWASGIHLWKLGSNGNFVKGNTSHHNWDSSDHHTDGNGVSIDKSQAGSAIEVSHNTVYENGGRGIDVNISSNVHLHHNFIYSNGRDPLIRDFGELCLSEPQSTTGFRMVRNTIRARDTTPAVVIYKADPKKVIGDDNAICHYDHPDFAFSLYPSKTFSLADWQQETGHELRSTSKCDVAKHLE